MRSLPIASWLAAALLLAAPAPSAPDPIASLLLASAEQDSLRSRLSAFAGQTTNRRLAALADHYRGMSYERGAQPDSAIACYRRSMASSRSSPSAQYLVATLLKRRAKGDAQEAIDLLEPSEGEEGGRAATEAIDPAWRGWAYVVNGDAKRGLTLLEPHEAELTNSLEWRYRLAVAYLEAGRADDARTHLVALDVAARGQDPEIKALMARAEKELSCELCRNEFHKMQRDMPEDARRVEEFALEALHARRLQFRASDAALIGGSLIADTTVTRPVRAAVVVGDPHTQLMDYDSLTVALRGAGFAVFILDPRGSGVSVGPGFALPDTWQGRQEALQARVARDLRESLRAFYRVAHIDTSRCLAVGVGSMAAVVLAAAEDDRRITAVALVDPNVAPVDWGAALKRAREMRLPLYAVVGPGDRETRALADTLVAVSAPKVSTVADAPQLDKGPRTIGPARDVAKQLVRWIESAMSAPPRREVHGAG